MVDLVFGFVCIPRVFAFVMIFRARLSVACSHCCVGVYQLATASMSFVEDDRPGDV